jgi:3-methylcrotonyl-CoA carboxylase alpha subunit
MKRVLIANRGEIAVRILRSLREMNLESVLVYAEPDRDSLAVEMADIALALNGVSALETYLDLDKIMDLARFAKVDAIHPGYGFLSEKPELVAACEKAGILFIGPDSNAIRVMGDKLASKALMEEGGVPTVPSFLVTDLVREASSLVEKGERLGYPLMVKAVSGGGGKGMRRVDFATELISACEACSREAQGAFSDGRIFVEKYIENPRHIEIQVFGDGQSPIVHLNERECSIQRRHQKIIEECPAPGISKALREEIGEVAIRAASLVNYTSAGTVEFILAPDGQYYFLEMNTRIQVEHPVTELCHNVDLVKEQLRVAGGASLSFANQVLEPRGHALECRLYAEEPLGDFRPASGKILILKWPQNIDGLRIDTGVCEGSSISIHFDPMIAKLITHGKDRKQAIERMILALRETVILGLETNQSFLLTILEDSAFQAGEIHTGFLEAHNLDAKLRSRMEADEPLQHLLAHIALISSANQDSLDPYYLPYKPLEKI